MATAAQKGEHDYVESPPPVQASMTNIDRDEVSSLPQDHRDYLVQRHGTLDLDPVPGFGNADPYNWPQWKKVVNLLLVAFHACMATFSAASIIPAFPDIAEDLGISLQRASYLTSLQIAILGGAPLFWRPLSNRYGRRPIFLFSLITSLVCNIGCAESPSYAIMATCRALGAFLISPAAAIGGAVVAETFFKKDRALYMGIWTLMFTLGVVLAPFLFGFVAYRIGYRWIFWILAMINGGQFILYLFLGPETRYLRKGVEHHGSDSKQEYWTFSRLDPGPFTLQLFVKPLGFITYAAIVVVAVAHSVIFLFANIMLTVEIPQLFAERFHLNAEKLGLQFLGLVVGSVIGEQVGGPLSDLWMKRRLHQLGTRAPPEFRLWLSYLGYLLAICGVVVFLVCIDEAQEGSWTVTPIIGAAIGAAGNQIVTTVLITYAVDCYHDEADSIGVFITFVRQIIGFIGPFWFPRMFTNVGLVGSAGLTAGLIVALCIIPTILLQWSRRSLSQPPEIASDP